MDTMFQNVLTASFHGSIVILVVIALRAVLKKTPKKFLCFLWLLAGLRLLMPFEIQSAFSLQPEPAVIQEQSWVQPEDPVIDNLPAQSRQEEIQQPAQNVAEVTPAEPLVLPLTEAGVSPAQPQPFLDWEALVPYFWLSVALCFGIYTVYCYLHLSYQVREAIKIPGGWECENIETAFILGFIRPRIYIPMGMPGSVRRHILAHERTHLEKGDHWFKMIGFLALAIHWFNPLVWVAYIMLCKDIEMACDERVVQFMDLEERKSYSAALLSCSTNRAHFAACPVAFGEVSVKERIKSVLNYRKPSFWISLAGVAAIFFVALCLLTNPVEEVPAAGETIPAETTESEPLTEEEKEAQKLTKEEELLSKVESGLENLLTGENTTYRLIGVDEESSANWQCAVQRQGENLYWHLSDYRYGGNVEAHCLILDGKAYEYENSVWLPYQEGQSVDPEAIARQWCNWGEMDELYNFKEVETTTTEGYTYHQIKFSGHIEEPYTVIEYTFEIDTEGNLLDIAIDGADSPYGDRLMLTDETEMQAITDEMNGGITVFDRAKENIMSREEYENTKIPSNRLDYDKDFMLGSGQSRWYYFDGLWQFACGAENATATGLTMFYCESGDGHISLTAEEGFWLETLGAEGEWDYYEPEMGGKAAAEEIQVSWDSRDTVNLSWADTYGALPDGFYRLGRYHTVTMPNGDTETTHAYVKFRIYNVDQDELLAKCRTALNNLINADSYHIYTFDWMVESDFNYYLREEYWKSGQDYLNVTRYPLREDMSQMWNENSYLWRGGQGYGITWAGEPMASEIKEWYLNRPGYVDGGNLDMWTFGLEWYDAQVTEVYQEGNNIHILEVYDFSEQYENNELIVTLDNSGNLKGIVKAYLPTRNCAEKDKVIAEELVVFDTPAAELRTIIDSVDVSSPMPFSYEEDVAANPDAQKLGFKNTTAKSVTTPAEALALAHEECTLPQLMEFEKGYCQSQTWFDENAGIWKVHLFWWQHDSAQTIYMDSQGITQMIVTVG